MDNDTLGFLLASLASIAGFGFWAGRRIGLKRGQKLAGAAIEAKDEAERQAAELKREADRTSAIINDLGETLLEALRGSFRSRGKALLESIEVPSDSAEILAEAAAPEFVDDFMSRFNVIHRAGSRIVLYTDPRPKKPALDPYFGTRPGPKSE